MPVLAVVVLAIAVASVTTAWLAADWARTRQAENVQRVAATLAAAEFPLTTNVLAQLRGLSGGEFVAIDAQARIVAATLEPDRQLIELLARLAEPSRRVEAWQPTPLAWRDHTYDCVRVAVADGARGDGAVSVVLLLPDDHWWSTSWQVVFAPLALGAIAAAAAALVVSLLAGRLVRPIQRLGAHTGAIAAGRFDPLPLPDRDDEVRDLARAINDMAARLAQFERQVRRSEQLRTLGQLGGGLAHQLRNSATGARMALDVYRRRHADDPPHEALAIVDRQLSLIEAYLQRLLALGRGPSERRAPVALADLAGDVLSLVEPVCRHAGVSLSYARPADPLIVEADADGLRQVLVNLVQNAIEAAAESPSPRAVEVVLEPCAGHGVRLAVGDTGPGPAACVQDAMFEPLVTTKPDGAGLGLAVVRSMVAEYGGHVRWRREAGQTWFECEMFPQPSEAGLGTSADCR